MADVASFALTSCSIRDDAEQALRRILGTSPQVLWLETMRRAKPGTHDSLVHWMLSQIQCDFSVAALAFYQADPTRHLDDPKPLPAQPKPDDTFAHILRHWDMGFYRQHAVQLKEEDCAPRLQRRVNQKLKGWPRGALPFVIPDPFLDPSGGEAQALPAHLSPDHASHLWEVFDRLNLDVPPTRPGRRGQLQLARKVIKKVTFQTRRV